jgi:3-oxoacyl-[acyl-carrier protein] reductase
MDLGLRGKRAVVTASSRGLGRAVADELAAEGCDVLICSRDPAKVEGARAEMEAQHDVRVVGMVADLTQAEGTQKVVDRAMDEFGGVDVLVTNNGGPPAGLFEAHTLEDWQDSYHRTLESVLVLIKGFLPGMKERGWGRILNVTSIAVKQPVDNLILSNSMRAAVTGLARTLANEVAPFGITVNNLMPGFHQTDRLDHLADHTVSVKGGTREDVFAAWSSVVPVGRIGRPEEFSALAAFLASERASYITGQSIPVDGGRIGTLL